MIAVTRGMTARFPAGGMPQGRKCMDVLHAGPEFVPRQTIACCGVCIATSITGCVIQTGTNDTQLGRRQPDFYLRICLLLPVNWL